MACPADYTVPLDQLNVMRVIKILIASKKGISNWQREVLLRHRLYEDLRFTDAGVRSLTPNLNDCFMRVKLTLTPDKVGKCKTVEDLVKLVWSNIPNMYKNNANA